MYTIRKATIDDAEIIRNIAEITWQQVYAPILSAEQLNYMLTELYSIAALHDQIGNNKQTLFMLLEGDTPVAYAGIAPREDDPEIYKLHRLYCLPSAHGKGYGRILIEKVGEEVLKAGKHTIDLNVNRHNNARFFYEKMGFKVIYEEDVPIGPYFMNDYVMRKKL